MQTKEYTLETFKKEMLDAECRRFAVADEILKRALEKWGCDYETLAQIAHFLIVRAHTPRVRDDRELCATYLYLCAQVTQCALNNLSEEDYHAFWNYGRHGTTYTAFEDLLEFYEAYA